MDWVEVGNLPADVSIADIYQQFVLYGIIPDNKGDPSIKLKGDRAYINYLNRYGVQNAVMLGDGMTWLGNKLTVKDVSNMGDDIRDELTLEQKRCPIDKKREGYLLSWDEDVPDDDLVKEKPRRCVLVFNMFTLAETMAGGVTFVDDLREEVKTECSKYGHIKHVYIFVNLPKELNGPCAVIICYNNVNSARKCQDALNERYFNGRRLETRLVDAETLGEYRSKEEEGAQKCE